SFGLDRIYLVMEELGLFPPGLETSLDILFLNFGEEEALEAIKLVSFLRREGIRADLYPSAAKVQKQFKYADRKGVPFVALLGEQELAQGQFVLKDMKTGEQASHALKDRELLAGRLRADS